MAARDRPAVLAFITKMRTNSSITLPDFSDYGLNNAWSLMQGGFNVPKAFKEQPCAVCGERDRQMYLARPEDLLGKRLYRLHWNEAQFTNLVWLVRGPCVRCYRKRGVGRTPFRGSGETSECRLCVRDLVKKREREGLPAISAKGDAENHGGCAWCGIEEHTDSEQFKGMGADRRCLECDH